MPILEWHPSEVTALAAAAARGLRGTVEIRAAGYTVDLTGISPSVYNVDYANVLGHNAAAGAVMDTTSLEAAEQAVRSVCGRSELDYERRRAQQRRGTPQAIPQTAALLAAVDNYCEDAYRRGVDFLTFRRLAEIADVSADGWYDLRSQLVAMRPDREAPPLWRVRAPG
jgi:hypothetical protein